jgi:glutamate dehydrogenase (NADP+)
MTELHRHIGPDTDVPAGDIGVRAICEGANMPTTPEAVAIFSKAARVLHAPSKAANAGGVAVSGLEMSQNSLRLQWSAIT